MSYRLSSTDLISTKEHGGLAWERSRIPAELGIGYADRLRLDEGLTLAISRYRPQRDLLEESVIERDTPSLTVTIALAGASSYQSSAGAVLDFLAGHTTVTAARATRGLRRYRAGDDVCQLRLIVDTVALRRYSLEALALAPAQSAGSACQVFHGASKPVLSRLAQRLLQGHARPDASLLEIQIAALSLLAEQGRCMAPPAKPAAWRPDEYRRICAARELIHQHFDQALTVAWLCAQVGSNEFTLKQGFRELFGSTPYRMLTEVRMQAALDLLAAGERVSSVAYRTGFQHPSNFSAAFRRYFGYAPKSVPDRSVE
ncbi:AraC-like DNA-binding protein [Paucibacter oligotrophus]|uniref:AraC-like DNA-binding protein n=1 Tax=Roseateles oligotrophus TaxID=1769250 RepID=A0A840LDH1_9BURK|nr:AraC family transcriptional regulator [Roseateles oligotrophus]MBB4844248.1 AraC-like DNA-binding protein [Roseateles oligotrophus]